MSGLEGVVAEWYQAADEHDVSRLAQLVTTDCEVVAPGVALKGPEQIAGWMRVFFAAFPDISHPITRTVRDNGAVAVQIQLTGTHTGPLVTPQGEIPPTHRKLDLRVANIVTTADGRVDSVHIYYDQLEFMTQLGLTP